MTVRLVVALVLVVLAAEAIVLAWATRSPGRPSFAALAPNLAAGAFLVLAIGSATTSDPLPPVALFVALGGCAHAWDLRRRWRTPDA